MGSGLHPCAPGSGFSPPERRLGMVTQSGNLALGRCRQDLWEFKVTLNDILSLRPAWEYRPYPKPLKLKYTIREQGVIWSS